MPVPRRTARSRGGRGAGRLLPGLRAPPAPDPRERGGARRAPRRGLPRAHHGDVRGRTRARGARVQGPARVRPERRPREARARRARSRGRPRGRRVFVLLQARKGEATFEIFREETRRKRRRKRKRERRRTRRERRRSLENKPLRVRTRACRVRPRMPSHRRRHSARGAREPRPAVPPRSVPRLSGKRARRRLPRSELSLVARRRAAVAGARRGLEREPSGLPRAQEPDHDRGAFETPGRPRRYPRGGRKNKPARRRDALRPRRPKRKKKKTRSARRRARRRRDGKTCACSSRPHG